MTPTHSIRALMLASGLALAAAPVAGAQPPSYQPQPDQAAPPNASSPYDRTPYEPNPNTPPEGYDGRELPPPPPGYEAGPDTARQDLEDRAYAEYAERWARANCVKAHGNPAAGAIVGGIIGSLLGAGMAGRGSEGAGAFFGGAIGAAGGAAIAGSADSNETSPGCPPGFVVRGGAPAFYFAGPYFYAAPPWYRPWVYWGGSWVYRPYPYHSWYYRHYYRRW
jgi:hypothetical protein